jgi:hypothetical protein
MIIYEYNISSFGYMIQSLNLFTAARMFPGSLLGSFL